mmetsp:Transcript_10664/g.30455  ORF Transcript_10664/g.30455 Transcript_10664/m.30455 type:complete len:232 (-) Transcript_10664:974-1669(-)
MPSHRMRWSSSLSVRILCRSWNWRNVSDPYGGMDMYLHMLTSCMRGMFPRVRLSWKYVAYCTITSDDKASPFRALSRKFNMDAAESSCLLAKVAVSSHSSSFPDSLFGRAFSLRFWAIRFCSLASSSRVSWKNWVIAMRDWSSRFMVSSAFNESWNVLGSMLGNRRKAKGSANSMNGIKMNMENGTMRNRSDTVRSSCLRSRRVSVEPASVLANKLRAVRISAISSLVPIQ